jgi:hypothetical protein
MRFLAALLLLGLAASTAIAAGPLSLPAVPAPGPVAGAGLGYLVLAGGYYAVRRWRKQNSGE